ncbi:MAG TPA: hypothetical protein VK171_15695 [Fimbriimonas sp.]|nr:hypothetical protein [Fimbriimonas sp.]
MTTHDDIRRICAKLPGATEGTDRFGFSVEVKGKHKGFLWTWAERVDPKKPKVINDGVIAISTPGLAAKEVILQIDPNKFFSEPHYDGFPAFLVRLSEVEPDELEDFIIEAWRCKAPKALQAEFDA